MTFVSSPVEDRFVNPLFEVFEGGDLILSSYRDVEDDCTSMRIYLADASDAPRACEALKAAGALLGLDLRPETGTIADEDWKFAYRRYFKTEVVSPRLAIRPAWEKYDPAPGQRVLSIDPGMAFGTGRHETTRACLEFIDRLAAENPDRSFLDVGCGSGILAVAAKLEGFRDVAGFDIDPDAVRTAKETAELNGVDVEFVRGDLCNLSAIPGVADNGSSRRADVVAANVLGPVLARFADEISRLVVPSPDSRLILSGILETVYGEVADAYAKRGFAEIGSTLLGEWRTGLFAPAAG